MQHFHLHGRCKHLISLSKSLLEEYTYVLVFGSCGHGFDPGQERVIDGIAWITQEAICSTFTCMEGANT